MSRLRIASFGALLVLSGPAWGAPDFEREVRPILEASCVRCHGPEKQKGKFRLDTSAGLLAGGENGAAVVPGKSAESALAKYVARQVEDMEMPPDAEEALTPTQVAALRAWIDGGAAYPLGTQLRAVKPTAAPKKPVALPPPVARKVDFAREVRPIFEASCFGCHGPRKQEAALRLDHKPTALKVIAVGKSAESLLVKMVGGLGEEMMPKEGARLSPEQIGILRAWIDQGADWPEALSVVLKSRSEHWAFKAPVKPALPPLKEKGWVRAPIDGFVQASLEKEGLRPSPEADRLTLMRRLYLDLIGLPPTLAEVDAYLADRAPNAYERLVDRLLASPHHGERWARHWLDAARYADSDGFEKDKSRTMWAYRDWVIGAFNRDLPYDRFVVEQLAGDLLPGATQDQIVATGFLRNSMINEEGGVDPEQFRMEAMFDRMDAIGKSILGLTIQCAQCHTHKYDPFSHDEYYRLFAFLNNDDEPMRAVYAPAEQKKRDEVLRRVAEAERRLQRSMPDWKERMGRWEKQLRAQQPAWVALQAPFIDDSTGGQKYLMLKDRSYLAQSYAPTKHNGQVVLKTELPKIGAIRLEALNDPNLPLGGPGRSFKGIFALSDIEIEAAPADAPDKKKKVKLVGATADFEQRETPLDPAFDDKSGKKRVVGPVAFAIDGKEETAWGIDAGPGRRNVERQAVFVPEAAIANPQGTILTVTLKQRHGGWNSDDHQNNNLGRFRISVADRAATAAPAPAFSRFRLTVAAWSKANAELEKLWKDYPEGATALVLQPRMGGRETHLLKRGDFLKPGKQVAPGVPAVLHPLPANAPPTRLTFARWLVDRKAPTAARVIVNRVWQAYFGLGLSSTPEDFGTQGEIPSHPELLDWLATELMDRGWRMKELHRLIVVSSTYRQASRVTPALQARDPFNRLLARGPRVRVEGEIVRDLFLAASGLLNPRVGGRSVMPSAPAFLFMPPNSYAPFPWVDETGGEKYRRAIYTFRRRSTPFPMLQTFDVPNGETSCARRMRSNTPLQALVTLNEPLSLEAAQALARRMLESGGESDRDRVAHGFRRVLSRSPSDAEAQELLTLLARQRQRIADGWADAWQIATGKSDRPRDLPAGATPAQLAAYTIVARVILNLDEAITKE